ncbi:F0F1 ATP synthase subunit A [Arthrobacter sp. Y-9]|uniref:F0F1 ATP synthase subunit A n=1 Tax=Arthrobacter sp. Y-9 TaxID=3039385 RepID=UPI00241BF242|nr:F0F1 ATP synthase subunit A [Arthrobacter sp. Y-9]WFR83020.1 F0F1 ATP synthase subunit A [Arthrobacter sp. Y-9]
MFALTLPAQDSGSFNPPGIDEMHLPAILPWGAADGFSKQMLLVILSVVIIAAFFLAAARKGKLVPGKLQFAGETAYGFVRNSIAKDIIGGKDFLKYVPLLFSLFFFILVNNIYGAIPVIQLPSFSHVGGAYVLAGLVYLTWIVIGVKKNGIRYFKLATVPSGVPFYILPLVIPIEIISNFVVRPITHSLRLFATMLAGHLIVMIAGSGIEFLISQESVLLKGTSILVLAGAVAMYMLEALIMVLQAYVFTLLTAIYIEGALHADSH